MDVIVRRSNNFAEARLGLDNPDLPVDFVRELLIARAEGPTLATPFVPEGQRD